MTPTNFIYRFRTELFLFFAALFIRLPFFFRDYIDQDESTFILMGQSIADGHLPYDHLWDLKPPLLFYIFGLVQKLFPHSFVAIRLFAVIIIFLSALLLLQIVKKAALKNGFIIALAYIILSSEFGSLQGLMSEHFAVFFTLAGFWLLVTYHNQWWIIIAGIALGCAILCKLNGAYGIALLLLTRFIWQWKNESLYTALISTVRIGSGILIPVAVIALPFLIRDKHILFLDSVFLAPLEYGNAARYTLLEKWSKTWWIIVVTAIVCFVAIKRSTRRNGFFVYCASAILAGIVYTFFSSGIVNGHYLVQLYPFLLLLALGVVPGRSLQPGLPVAALIVLVVSVETHLEWYRLYRTRDARTQYRPGFKTVAILKNKGLDKSRIFFADYHIGYWMLHQYPLTKSTTHPSNIARPFLFKYFNDDRRTSLQELTYLLEEVRPDIIVSKMPRLVFFDEGTVENAYFQEMVSTRFQRIYEDSSDRIFIWQRLK